MSAPAGDGSGGAIVCIVFCVRMPYAMRAINDGLLFIQSNICVKSTCSARIETYANFAVNHVSARLHDIHSGERVDGKRRGGGEGDKELCPDRAAWPFTCAFDLGKRNKDNAVATNIYPKMMGV